MLRSIYQTVLRAYKSERQQEAPIRLSTRFRARRSAEFIADFELCAKRALNLNDYDLFRRYVIWELPIPPARKHDLEQIEIRLGRAFAEMHPYALWPLHLYFGTTPRKRRRAVHH